MAIKKIDVAPMDWPEDNGSDEEVNPIAKLVCNTNGFLEALTGLLVELTKKYHHENEHHFFAKEKKSD